MRVSEGSVLIIRDSLQFGNLRSGVVSVAPHTNPAWTPHFQRAAAVVPTFDKMLNQSGVNAVP
jgi:phosphoenolpyruvate synthase/pyruvate phosphate dikinase